MGLGLILEKGFEFGLVHFLEPKEIEIPIITASKHIYQSHSD